MIKYDVEVNEKIWHIKFGSKIAKLIGSYGYTWGDTTRFVNGIVPDAASLAHEYGHVGKANILRYALSSTIGKLWGDKYALNQEAMANEYAKIHKNDAVFVQAADTLRRRLPSDWPTVTITNTP